MLLGGLPVEDGVSAGAWVAEALHGRPAGTVAALVPDSFPARARVLHPAYRYADDDPADDPAGDGQGPAEDLEVPWAEVAALNGTVVHPLVQWPALTGSWEYLTSDSQPPVWDGAPADGHLPVPVARRLAAVLAGHTGTPGECWFGRWEGFGWDAAALAGTPRLVLGGHGYVLVRGTVDDAARNLAPEPFEQSANLWWPADRAWFVATGLDLTSTYLGGSPACVAAVLAAPGLEALPAAPGDGVGWRDDPVNPPPA